MPEENKAETCETCFWNHNNKECLLNKKEISIGSKACAEHIDNNILDLIDWENL